MSKLSVGETKILDINKWGSISGSVGTNFLVLERTDNTYKLCIMGYEAIAEVSDYTDENGNEKIPETIGGIEVVGTEAEYIVGGELSNFDGNIVEFKSLQDEK